MPSSARPPAVKTPWFAGWFDEDYLVVYGHRDASDAERGVALLARAVAPRPGARLLDLACGPGRHARPLARLGYRVVGLDLSPALLAAARAAGPEPLVRADMRRLPFRERVFDVVLSFFTSFGYFDDADNARLLAEVKRVLAPRGTLFLDYLNPAHALAHLAPERRREAGGMLIEERYRVAGTRLLKDIAILDPRGRRHHQESVRLYGPEELRGLLEAAGLLVEQRFGDLDGGPFDARRSPRQVVIARRGP